LFNGCDAYIYAYGSFCCQVDFFIAEENYSSQGKRFTMKTQKVDKLNS